MLSTNSGPKIPSVGHAVQSVTSETQEFLVPTSPSPPPRSVTGNLRSTFPGKSTQRSKRRSPVSATNRTLLPKQPVAPSSKRKRGDNEIISADDWAKRLKRDYYQDTDYGIVDPDYLLFWKYAARVASLVRSPPKAGLQSQNHPIPRVRENPTHSGISAVTTISESNDASQFQGDMPEEDFLASVSSLW